MKVLRSILLSIALLLILPTMTKAATVSVKGVGLTASPGESGTVYVKAYGSTEIAGGQFDVTSSSKYVIITSVGGSGIFTNFGSDSKTIIYNAANKSSASGSKIASIKVKISEDAKVGSKYYINITNVIVSLADDYNTYNASGINIPVTIVEKEAEKEKVKSNDATLSSLEANISLIDFSKNQDTYNITVENNITSLDLSSITNNKSAKVTVTGNEGFKVGLNTITIKVTAEDGTIKTYTINVTRLEKGETVIPDNKECPSTSESLWKYIAIGALVIMVLETIFMIVKVNKTEDMIVKFKRKK